MTLIDVLSRLKSIRRFNLYNYREGEFGIDTEREYDCNGDYIDSYEIDDIISELEEMKHTEVTMKKQTAVEWLIESLEKLKYNLENGVISIEDYIINVQWAKGKAKAMERQQTVDSYLECWMMDGGNADHKLTEANEYYNKIYGGEQ
jgi:hypothetical protein